MNARLFPQFHGLTRKFESLHGGPDLAATAGVQILILAPLGFPLQESCLQ